MKLLKDQRVNVWLLRSQADIDHNLQSRKIVRSMHLGEENILKYSKTWFGKLKDTD